MKFYQWDSACPSLIPESGHLLIEFDRKIWIVAASMKFLLKMKFLPLRYSEATPIPPAVEPQISVHHGFTINWAVGMSSAAMLPSKPVLCQTFPNWFLSIQLVSSGSWDKMSKTVGQIFSLFLSWGQILKSKFHTILIWMSKVEKNKSIRPALCYLSFQKSMSPGSYGSAAQSAAARRRDMAGRNGVGFIYWLYSWTEFAALKSR